MFGLLLGSLEVFNFLFVLVVFQISYCQGMSDIASPILAVMDNEAHTFICFCGIMKRLEGNFRQDGQLMSVKFQHLKLLLQYSDPEFYAYLVSRGADDLFFCYRWLLLELKREFAFDDALRMLEVTWSSLPPDPPETEVELLGPPSEAVEMSSCRDGEVEHGLKDDKAQEEKQRRRHMLRPSREEPDLSRNFIPDEKDHQEVGSGRGTGGVECDRTRETAEESAQRRRCCQRQTSFGEFKYYTARNEDSFDMEDADEPHGPNISRRQSTLDSEDDPGEQTPLIKNGESGVCPVSSRSLLPGGLPAWKTGSSISPTCSVSNSSRPEVSPDSPPKSPSTNDKSEAFSRTAPKVPTSPAQALSATGTKCPTTAAVKMSVTSPSHVPSSSRLSSPVLSFGSLPGSRSSAHSQSSPGIRSPVGGRAASLSIKPCSLPPPQEFGKGNPFMLFLCLSILLEHRDHIIKNNLDYNEIAMHFDHLVRRHNLSRVLQRAKALFADYLQSEVWDSEEGDEVSSDSPTAAAPQSPPSSMSAQPVHSPLASPASSPNSTYNLATTVPSPRVPLSPVS